MNLHRRLAALFLILALAGCAPVATGEGPAPDAPDPHDDEGNVHDRGFSMEPARGGWNSQEPPGSLRIADRLPLQRPHQDHYS